MACSKLKKKHNIHIKLDASMQQRIKVIYRFTTVLFQTHLNTMICDE